MDPSNINVVTKEPSQLLQWVEIAGIWFTGVATFLAVVLAWSIRRLWERRQRPVLALNYNGSSQEDSRYVPPMYASGFPSLKKESVNEREELWVRVQVKNNSKTTARNVQLRLLSIQRERKSFPENRPKWWFKASNLDATSISIHPQLPEHFDIAYVKNILGEDDGISFYLTLVPQDLQPWNQEKDRIEKDEENNSLEVGWEYSLQLALFGDNVDVKCYQLKLKVDAPASEDPSTKEWLGEKNLRNRVHFILVDEIKVKNDSY